MKHSFLDKYSDGNSIIHRLDPRTKLIATLVFIFLVVLLPSASWITYGLYFMTIAALIIMSRVPITYIFRRSLVVIPFVLTIAIFIPFFKDGIAAFSFNILSWHLSVTYGGLETLGSVMAKAWLSILALVLLTSTTAFSNILKALEHLKMPQVLVMIMSFMYRYIFLLTDEVMRMKQARDSRNFGSGGKRLWQIRTVGNMIGTLFIRSYERGERVYASMVARGFDGHSRTLDRLYFGKCDAVFIAAWGSVLALISLFNLLY
ncbi:MAG: cobalt ECF transporter T component CbiQ [Dehalococcoidales bacterium]|nr:cobalt ECF transporter T component CbiQ [Dehalococcoidales bacterium]